jgi:hypothetical protein
MALVASSLCAPMCGVGITCGSASSGLSCARRLLLEGVQRGPGQTAAHQRRQQRRLVHQLAARGVDEIRAGLHLLQEAGVDHVPRGRQHRHVQRHHVSLRQQVVQRDQAARRACRAKCGVGRPRHTPAGSQSKPASRRATCLADGPQSDQSHRFAHQRDCPLPAAASHPAGCRLRPLSG